ncbi:MAG: hypothetical protein ACJAYA_000403 [Bacteroidia bacterium]|jgi:hypothetical protein
MNSLISTINSALVERSRNHETLRLRSGSKVLSATFFLFSFFLFASSEGFAQHTKIDWAFLAKVEWGEKYFEEYEEVVFYPDFGKEVLAVDNTLVEIEGYVIPVDVESGYYVLSANPFASCFFCGNAGPESVMELQFPESMKDIFKTDEIITFRGRLKLNWDDLEHCNYILQKATPK